MLPDLFGYDVFYHFFSIKRFYLSIIVFKTICKHRINKSFKKSDNSQKKSNDNFLKVIRNE